MTSKPDHTYGFWEESSFATLPNCGDAILADQVLMVACEETPPEVKVAIEQFFLGESYDQATDTVRADGLILNAIFWIMHQTGFDDFIGICRTYLMLPQYQKAFLQMQTENEQESDFDYAEWEARYQQS